jgi:excisionase family DNA binding protein
MTINGKILFMAIVDDLITVPEAAQRLHVSTSTIWRWIRSGELRSYRLGPKRVLLRTSELSQTLRPKTYPKLAGSAAGRGRKYRSLESADLLNDARAERTAQLTEAEFRRRMDVRPLTPEERRVALEVLERIERSQARLLEERGGRHFKSSARDIRAARSERDGRFR